VANGMPREFGYEWSASTLQQKKSEGEAGRIFGMAILFVFLLLAAQYESWALPFAVLPCTPLVMLGNVALFGLRDCGLVVFWARPTA
jgi:multidrug efflux pump subunit AcrB